MRKYSNFEYLEASLFVKLRNTFLREHLLAQNIISNSIDSFEEKIEVICLPRINAVQLLLHNKERLCSISSLQRWNFSFVDPF